VLQKAAEAQSFGQALLRAQMKLPNLLQLLDLVTSGLLWAGACRPTGL
jgi:hypothetical protein